MRTEKSAVAATAGNHPVERCRQAFRAVALNHRAPKKPQFRLNGIATRNPVK